MPEQEITQEEAAEMLAEIETPERDAEVLKWKAMLKDPDFKTRQEAFTRLLHREQLMARGRVFQVGQDLPEVRGELICLLGETIAIERVVDEKKYPGDKSKLDERADAIAHLTRLYDTEPIDEDDSDMSLDIRIKRLAQRYQRAKAGLDDDVLTDAEVVAAMDDLMASAKPVPLKTRAVSSWTMDDLADVPPKRWLVEDWLPEGELAMLSGHGETGKSRLALQLAAALASDRNEVSGSNWLPPHSHELKQPDAPSLCEGSQVVVYSAWEDGIDEAKRRLGRMGDVKTQAGEVSFGRDGLHFAATATYAGRLHFVPMRGAGPLWGVENDIHMSVRPKLLPAGRELLAYAKEVKAKLVILDPGSLALSVSESDRQAVSLVLEHLSGWTERTGCAVLLLTHPPKYDQGGGRESSGYSGSTAWRGLCRALWTLQSPVWHCGQNKCGGEGGCPKCKQLAAIRDDYRARKEGIAVLALNKSNYSFSGTSLTIETTGKGSRWVVRAGIVEDDLRGDDRHDECETPIHEQEPDMD